MATKAPRMLRSRSKTPALEASHLPPSSAVVAKLEPVELSPYSEGGKAASALSTIRIIRTGDKLPFLTSAQLNLLRQKQAKLKATAAAASRESGPVDNALFSTLIFAQYEAGTAVCIDRDGWVLTCAHCFGDDEDEIRSSMPARRWLLFYTGTAVLVECRAWDAKRDLALLKIIAIEHGSGAAKVTAHFCHVQPSSSTRTYRLPIMCIGQPGRDDLESAEVRKTTYDLFEVSYGALRGLVLDADPQDNSEIGTLKHDAWTYWGHSGAPLLKEDDCTLVGLHSSWDDQTTMRHGVPLVAIQAFLAEHLPSKSIS